jgi:hypothetical protein
MPDMKNWIADNAYGIYFTALMAVCIFFMAVCLVHSQKAREAEKRDQIYPAWVKVHPSTNLTYDEWNVLYRKNLLPK